MPDPAISEPNSRTFHAKGLIKERRYAEAETLLLSILKENPCDDYATGTLTNLYSWTGDLEKAEILFASAMLADTLTPYMCAEMIRSYSKAGQMESAREIFDAFHNREADCSHVFCAMMECYRDAHDTEKTREIFDLSESYGYSHRRIHGAMIKAYSRSGRYMEATATLVDAIQRGIVDAQMFTNMIHALDFDHRTDDIFVLYDLAARYDVLDRILCRCTVFALADSGLVDRARIVFDKASELGLAEEKMLDTITDQYLRAGRVGDVRSLALKEMGKDWFDPDAISSILGRLMNYGYERPARELLKDYFNKKGFSKSPFKAVCGRFYTERRYYDVLTLIGSLPEQFRNEPYVIVRKAECFRKVGSHDRAIAMLRDAISSGALDDYSIRAAKSVIGFSLKDSGRFDEAFVMFKGLIDAKPENRHNSARAACGLAFAWEQKGRTGLTDEDISLALSALKGVAVSRNPNFAQDIRNAIKIFENQEKRGKKPDDSK